MSLMNSIAVSEAGADCTTGRSGRRGMENLVGLLKPRVHVIQRLPSAFSRVPQETVVRKLPRRSADQTFQIRLEVYGWKIASI